MITGCAGFLGSNLAKHLLQDSRTEVIGVDDFTTGKRELIQDLSKYKNFRLVHLDCRDTDKLLEHPSPNLVIHLAANSDISAAIVNPLVDYELGIETTQAMLEYSRRAGIKHFVFSSGSGVYGENPNLIFTEDSFVGEPTSTYGATKLASEALISAYAHMFEIRGTVFRFSNLVGPNQTHGVIHDFLLKLKENQDELEVLGNGTQLKPYIHISDAIKGIDIALKNQSKIYEVFNVSNTSSTSVAGIAELVIQELKLNQTHVIYQEWERGWKSDIPKYSMSSKKLFDMGWEIEFDSDQAVTQAIKENRKILFGG